MDMKIIAIVLSVFSVVFDYAACDKVTSPPSNGLFQVGSTFVLSCSVDGLSAGNVLQWTEYQTTTTGNNICTVSTVGTSCDPKYPRYKLESSQGWHNLTISNAVIADGGTYKCWFVLGQNPPVSDAQVVIFDALAINVPSSASINQPVPVSCTVNYQSVPYYQLLPGAKPLISLTAGTNITSSSDALVPVTSSRSITITLNATLFVQSLSQLPVNVMCTISISNPLTTFNNVVPANIIYPPQTVTISPVKTQYAVDDNITCSADGYPAPTLTWTDVPASGSAQTVPQAIGTSNLTLTSGWVGPSHNLTCSAVNSVSGSQPISSSITFTVVDASPGASSESQQNLAWIAAAVIVPVVVIVAVIVIVVICLKKRKSKQQTKTPQPIARSAPQYNGNSNNLNGSNSLDGKGVREPPFTISKGPTYDASPMGPNSYLPSTNAGQMTPTDRRQLTRDSPAGFGALGMNNNVAYPAGPRNLSASFDEGGRTPQLSMAPTGRVNSSFAHDGVDLNSSRSQAPGGRINTSFQPDGNRVNNNPYDLPPSAKVNTSIPQGATARPNDHINRSNGKLNDSFPLDGRFTYQPTTRVNDSPEHGGSLNSSVSGSFSHNESDHGSPQAPYHQPHHQYQPTGVYHNRVVEPDTMV